MAFWGVEVKPGKPFKHVFDSRRGRLRISQATLGYGPEKIRSLVQCNVGNKTPVLLCCLLPDKTESCSLDLEFEEADEVIFSVIGPRSVHIAGYYSRNTRHSILNDESESYGEDIANSESQSNRQSDEDDYDDSFIDDNVSEANPLSPLSPLSNGEVAIEDTADGIKPINKKGFKRLKKKYQLSESDNADNLQQQKVASRRNFSTILESEDEDIDILPLSLLYKKENTADNTKLDEEKGGNEPGEREKAKEANVEFSFETNIKHEAIAVVDEPERQSCPPLNSLKPSTGGAAPETDIKPKKKRKERSSEKKALENCSPNNINDLEDDNTKQNKVFSTLGSNPPMEDQHQLIANDKKDGMSHTCSLPSIEINPKDDTSSKKKRKKRNTEESNLAVDNAARGTFPKEDKNQLEGDKADNICQDQSVKNGTIMNYVNHSVGEKHSEEKKTKKKKKSKTQEIGENLNSNLPPLSTNVEPVKTFQVKMLSNGLIIEELEMGKPDGQVASQGKRISVRYTGKLKENGHIFDTNIDGDPFKFRLGKGIVIDGWDIGLEGMRVGGRRRITVPPSLGYGSEGDNENVPPNSWLVYDVELISAR